MATSFTDRNETASVTVARVARVNVQIGNTPIGSSPFNATSNNVDNRNRIETHCIRGWTIVTILTTSSIHRGNISNRL